MKVFWPVLKGVMVLTILSFLYLWYEIPFWQCLLGYVMICYIYQPFIAMATGLKSIQAMDQVCFLSSSKSVLNVEEQVQDAVPLWLSNQDGTT